MSLVTRTGPTGHAASGPRSSRGPQPGTGATVIPPAGQPGHGLAAVLRRQPVRIVDGRMEGGYTAVFEVICRACGDHPDLDYVEVTPRLQALRGPRTLEAGLAEYERHIGLAS
jgi:hypothetical protein